MQQVVLSVMRQLLLGPGAEQLIQLNLDVFLIDQLCFSLDQNRNILQAALIDTLLAALKIRFAEAHSLPVREWKRHGRLAG